MWGVGWRQPARSAEADQGQGGGHVEELEVHPVNLRELPQAFHFHQGSERI